MNEISWIDDETEAEEEPRYSITIAVPGDRISFSRFCRILEKNDKLLRFLYHDKEYIVPFNSIYCVSIEEIKQN